MCNSNSGLEPQFFQEKITGNFNGGATPLTVWTAPAGSYFSGTFEIFNSAASPATVTGATDSTPAGALSASPGNSTAVSVNQPTEFTITAAAGDSGTFCIILYKKVLA
jgi:hypothetical protein